MKLKRVFEYHNYRDFIEDYIASRPHNGHGEKSKIAEAIRCHNAYLSQVLQGKTNLSLEQAHAFTEYMSFSPEEVEFFLVLLQHERAGSQELKNYFLSRIKSIEASRALLENRLDDAKTLSRDEQNTYFSMWYHSVIHLMISTLKGYQTLAAITNALSVPAPLIRESIQFLEKSGLIIKKGAEYAPGPVNIHLSNDSKMILAYHLNWRMQAIRSIENQNIKDLHYSSAVTIRMDEFEKIRKLMGAAIEDARAIAQESSRETQVAVLSVDWFSIPLKPI